MKRAFIYLLCSLSLLTACDYPLHENFIEVAKPQDQLNVSIDLNAITNGQAILINRSTNLYYSLSAFGKNIKRIEFTMGSHVWSSDVANANSSIWINEYMFSSGKYTLTCKFFAESGSGSIADQLGEEGYVGTKSWPVIIDYNLNIPSTLTYRTNADGFFELDWMQPQLSHLKVLSYRIECQDVHGYRTETAPAGAGAFVDKKNVGAETTYNVYMNLSYEGSSNLLWPLGELKIPGSIKLYTSSWDLKKVNLRWSVPYKCAVTFTINSGTPFIVPAGQDSISVPVTAFGSMSWSDQNEVQMQLSSVDAVNEPLYSTIVYAGSPGVYIEHERGAQWAYSPVTGLMYAANNDEVNAYKTSSAVSRMCYREANGGFRDLYASSVSARLAVSSGEGIRVLDGRTMSVQHSFVCPSKCRMLGFTTDDKLLWVSMNGNNNECMVHVCNLDGSTVAEIPAYLGSLEVSPDGRFICYSSDFKMHVLALENYQVVKDYIWPVPYESQGNWRFNPKHPDQLILTMVWWDHKIEVRHCPDYALVSEYDLPDNTTLADVDPLTGNLLLTDNSQLYVRSSETWKELFRLKSSYSIGAALNGNTLTSFDGYIMNIENYLQK